MILSAQQISEVLEIIDRYTLTFITHHVSPDVLTVSDKAILNKAGINIKNIPVNRSNVTQAFRFGMLSQALQDSAAKAMSYEQFKNYLKAGKLFKLYVAEQSALKSLQYQTYRDVLKLGSRIKDGIADAFVHVDKKRGIIQHSKTVTDAGSERRSSAPAALVKPRVKAGGQRGRGRGGPRGGGARVGDVEPGGGSSGRAIRSVGAGAAQDRAGESQGLERGDALDVYAGGVAAGAWGGQ